MTVNITTLMQRLGHAFFIGEATNATLGGTVPTRVDAFLAGLGTSLGVQYEDVRSDMLDGLESLQAGGSTGNASLIQQPVQELILQTVMADKPAASTLDLAVRELIKQFEDTNESFEASSVSSSVAYDIGNIGNGVGLVSVKRDDGKFLLFAFSEDLVMFVQQIAPEGDAIFTVVGAPSVDDLMPTWPKGSGAGFTLQGKTASSIGNLIGNGTFETNDPQSVHLPLGWFATTGTLGALIKMGPVEVQTVTISGGPTGGFYTLLWQSQAGQNHPTPPIPFDGGGDAVQEALQSIVGLGGVEVTTVGVAPALTHTIVFNGVTNSAQLTSQSSMVGGAIAHATTVAGSPNVMRGARAVEFDSDGATFTSIATRVFLEPSTQYCFNCFMKSDVVPASGVISVDLVDGVAGATINDASGTANVFTVPGISITNAFTAKSGVFRTPAVLPSQVYLRIRISTVISPTSSIFIDEAYLGVMDEAYPGGPGVAIFAGSIPWQIQDRIVATILNNRAGLLHEWMNRVLGLRESGLIFPTNAVPTQSDALVS